MGRNPVIVPFKEANHSHGRCLDTALARAERVCRERRVRLTPLRRRVLELVWGSHEPVKAYELLDRLRDEHQGAAPPTVYRALEFLLQQGFVHRLVSLNAYIGCGEPGHDNVAQFLICRHCGEVAELDDAAISRLLETRAGELGFSVQGYALEVRGCCAKCGAGA